MISYSNLGDSMNEMNNTFRGEGISVKYDRFRIEGEEINMEVLPVISFATSVVLY